MLDIRTLKDLYKLVELRRLGKNEKFICYKYVKPDRRSPSRASDCIAYDDGKLLTVEHFNDDEKYDCGAGINVACKTWITPLNVADTIYYDGPYKSNNPLAILVLVSCVNDVVAFPFNDKSSHHRAGKFRLKKARVLGQVGTITNVPGEDEKYKVAFHKERVEWFKKLV